MRTYTLRVVGLQRELPILRISKRKEVAFFQMLGDVELCEKVANEFIRLARGPCNYIVTPALKSVGLAHELARQTGTSYIVLQKSQRPYMVWPLSEPVESFISHGKEVLYLDSRDAERIKGEDVWIVDDVITSGNTLRAVQTLIERAGARVTGKFVVLKEGNSAKLRDDVISLGELPILPSSHFGRIAPSPKTTIVSGFQHRTLELKHEWPVVYTAMSKHMFYFRVSISRFVLEQKMVPLNPFMNFDFGFFGLVPKDSILTANNNALRVADESWVFGPISDGVQAEILIAKELGMPIRYFTVTGSGDIKELSESNVKYEEDIASFQLKFFEAVDGAREPDPSPR